MGPLLEYMEQVVSLRLSSEGTSRTLGRTNFRYVQDDPERARDWQYLFDRVPIAEGRRKKRRGRLSGNRVNEALHEALLLAAKHDSEGLFVAGTSQLSCQHRRSSGQECRYFAVCDGITTCPRCGSRLSGQRGSYCHHILEEDFVCDGVALSGEVFCPKCDAPLAQLLPISTHVFRHNSVSRAGRAGVSVSQNMRLHGHETIPMHLHYIHFQADEMTQKVREMFVDKRLQSLSQVQVLLIKEEGTNWFRLLKERVPEEEGEWGSVKEKDTRRSIGGDIFLIALNDGRGQKRNVRGFTLVTCELGKANSLQGEVKTHWRFVLKKRGPVRVVNLRRGNGEGFFLQVLV